MGRKIGKKDAGDSGVCAFGFSVCIVIFTALVKLSLWTLKREGIDKMMVLEFHLYEVGVFYATLSR
jgi:hypothetical protein